MVTWDKKRKTLEERLAAIEERVEVIELLNELRILEEKVTAIRKG